MFHPDVIRTRLRFIALLPMLAWCTLDPAVAAAPPATAYAHFMSDAGLSTDTAGAVTRWTNQTGVSARDLDRIIGVPKTATYSRSNAGGTANVVLLDGNSALWATATNWGSITGDRSVVARVRINGTSNGFLFDGSTGSGKTRAQINSGNWQAGVQSSSSSTWTSSDLVTTALVANTWQTHLFEFDDNTGSTTIRHFIDGINVGGGGNLALTTALGGFILGANGATSGKLNAEVAEILVYNRLLSTTDKSAATTYLQDKWGDLVDLPLSFVSATTVQNNRSVARIGIHGIAALGIVSSGNVSTPGYALAGIDFDLSGTTDLNDISEIQIHASNSGTTLDAGNTTLLATLPPAAGTLSATFNRQITALSSWFWIAAKMRGSSTLGDSIDASITSFHLAGEASGSRFPTITSPPEKLTIDSLIYRTVLHAEDQDGVHIYRIPALVTTNAGTLIAGFDLRYNGSPGSAPDLPADIDIGIRRSTDGGITWTPMQLIMDYDKNDVGSSGNGIADPTLLVDKVTGRIWCAALWSFGNRGWSGSGPGLTPAETGQFLLNYSDDDGVTWSQPVSITPQIKDPAWRLYFQGPGKGICLRDGTLVFPAQFKDASNVAFSNFIFSKDRGVTWENAPPANPSGSPQTNEAQIVELDDGNLLISMKNFHSGKKRLWCIYSWDHATQTIHQGSWGTPWYSENDPTVQGSVERYRSVLDGHPFSALLFANPDSATSRSNMSVRISLDEGLTWPYKRAIDSRPAAYSCMTILPDGEIGMLYETGDTSSISDLTFARFPIEWITGTADSDNDGIPDFHEDATGFNKSNGNDALLDSDGDGHSNLSEYLAGTHPQDASSVFRIRSMTHNTATHRHILKWQAAAYRRYRVESSPSLAAGSWQVVEGMENIPNGSKVRELEVEIPTGEEPQQFYRITPIQP